MSYENAPATKLLATRCVVCRRALLDAKSVEAGIGPDCRKKYGFDIECSEQARMEANHIVHYLATMTTEGKSAEALAISIQYQLASLKSLGFTKLADTLADRMAPIRITEIDASHLLADMPYNPDALPQLRRLGRAQYNGDKFQGWVVPTKCRAALWSVMKEHYTGQVGVGAKGMFVVKA